MNKTLHTTIQITLIFIFNVTFAQDKGVIAKSEYMAAETAYGSGDYEKSLKHLDNAQDMVRNNRLIQYLRVKSYYNLKDYPRTKEELTLYFEVTEKKYSGTEEYEEMVGMIAPVNEAVERQAKIGSEAYSKIKNHLDRAIELLSQGNTKEANTNVIYAYKFFEDELADIIDYDQFKTVFAEEFQILEESNSGYKKMTPSEYNYYYNIAWLSGENGEFEKAIEYYKRSILAEPYASTNPYINMGSAMLEEDKELAKEMNKNLNNHEVYDKLKAEQIELYNEVLPIYEKAYSIDPRNADTVQTLMSLYEATNRENKQKEMKKKLKILNKYK